MFKLLKDDQHLSFTVERGDSQFGEGHRVLFWIDKELQMLQRGRQEYIPIDTIEEFFVADDGAGLYARFGDTTMLLYESAGNEESRLQEAAEELNEYCSLARD